MAPLAVFARIANADRVEALCEAAEALGLRPGASLAEARARFPQLDLVEGDATADAGLLAAIADWCDRYTPLVALDGPDGLILDISGCAHLFGGEKALMDDLLARLFHQGFAASAAIASQAATARALVLHRPGAQARAGDEIAAIAPLPVAALRLPRETQALLGRLGLKSVGDLLALPRAGLARRCGKATMARLDEAAGRAERPISPRLPVPFLIHERRLFEPISLSEDVQRILRHLADRLKPDLERRGEGARHLQLALFRVDGKVERIDVRTGAPLRDPARIERLFAERLKASESELDAGYGYDLVKLTVLVVDAMSEIQEDLGASQTAFEDLESLLDRLGARLGETAVGNLQAIESHRPERAQILRSARTIRGVSQAEGPGEARTGPSAPRPLRLFGTPEPIETIAAVPEGAPERFRWRRALYRVRRVEGPERIAPEWWRADRRPARDYWRVEDDTGRRYWLFREGCYGEDELSCAVEGSERGVEERHDPAHGDAGQAGLESTAAIHPRWYLHGIFA